MLTALILICSTTMTPDLATCTRQNAETMIRVPSECGTPTTCFMNAQAYLAQTSLGRELGPDDRVKIICVHSGAIAPAP
jgi:hypothetical protein